jgi:uncharacterized protein YdgA (DUF945 family)
MRKSAAAGAVVVVLAAAWLGATWYTGKRMEAESPAKIADANQKLDEIMPGEGMKLEQISFERGFFSSHARYGFSMIGGEGHTADKPLLPSGVVEIDVTADHGPFPLKALARGSVMPVLAYVHAELAHTGKLQPWFDATQGKAPLSMDEVIAYNGDTSGTSAIAPVHVEHADGKFDFSGVTAQTSYTLSAQALKMALQMPSLMLDLPANPSSGAKGGLLRIEGVAVKGDTHLGKSKLSVGNNDLSIKHIEFKSAGEPASQLALDDVHQSTDTSETGDAVNMQLVQQLGGLKVNGVDLGSGQLAFKLAGVKSDAVYGLVQAYSRFIAQLRQQAAAAKDKDQGGDVAAAPDPTEVLTALQAALAGSPTLSIDPLVWKTDKGEGRLIVNLNLTQPPASASKGPAQAFLLQALKTADAKLTLSQPMMRDLTARYMTSVRGVPADQASRQAAQQVTGLAVMGQMTGLARAEGDNLVSDFHYADGKMLLNGHDPKLGALLNPAQ